MGIITLAVLGLTAVGLLFGALFGAIRGRARALLRLILVVLSAVLAFALRGFVVDLVMDINVEGATLKETLISGFGSGEEAMPAGMQNLVFALLEIIIGFVSYFILLFVIRLLTWIFIFPFLKLIIRSAEKKRLKRELGDDYYNTKRRTRKKMAKKKRHRGAGALIGLAQGVLVAFFLFAPLTGLLVQVDKLTSIKINGEAMLELPAEIGVKEYPDSFMGKIYNTTGHWYYNMMTTTKDADGNEVSLDATLNILTTLLDVVDTTASLEEDLNILSDENATPEEKIDALDALGDKLISVGNSMGELDQNTMDMIKDLATDMMGEDVSQDEIDEMMEMFTKEFFVEAGNGIKAFATYEKAKNEETTLTQEDVNDIVNKAYKGISIVGEFEIETQEEHKDMFKTAIDAIENITEEDKSTLYSVFGIVVEND